MMLEALVLLPRLVVVPWCHRLGSWWCRRTAQQLFAQTIETRGTVAAELSPAAVQQLCRLQIRKILG
jgi:hypothetical protein